ncbi:hypothetical protein CW304_03775 [Bacillus sp. UFRGS-B20]|nr:hypothetical protein CW304_03775 [Bacillus sp. UFRGS-B20]
MSLGIAFKRLTFPRHSRELNSLSYEVWSFPDKLMILFVACGVYLFDSITNYKATLTMTSEISRSNDILRR